MGPTARSWGRTAPGSTAEAYREAVLGVVASIPRGRVMTYAGIADYLAESWRRRSPRLVGHIMAGCDGRLPWHRVVQAGGKPVRGHEAEALRRLRADGTPLTGSNAERVDMRRAAWAPEVPPFVPEVPPPGPGDGQRSVGRDGVETPVEDGGPGRQPGRARW